MRLYKLKGQYWLLTTFKPFYVYIGLFCKLVKNKFDIQKTFEQLERELTRSQLIVKHKENYIKNIKREINLEGGGK